MDNKCIECGPRNEVHLGWTRESVLPFFVMRRTERANNSRIKTISYYIEVHHRKKKATPICRGVYKNTFRAYFAFEFQDADCTKIYVSTQEQYEWPRAASLAPFRWFLGSLGRVKTRAKNVSAAYTNTTMLVYCLHVRYRKCGFVLFLL